MAAVLVVDDDPTVREVVITYLTKAGHTVKVGSRRERGPGFGGAVSTGAGRPRPDAAGSRRARGVPPVAREQRHPRDHADGQGDGQ